MINICSTARKSTHSRHSGGFALPTVIIASIIMLAVLLVSIASTTAIRASLTAQTYNQLAQNASDAGVAYANACLVANAGVPLWTDNKPLMPNTDCSGNQLSGFTCTINSTDSRCSVTVNSSVISSFSVGSPTFVSGTSGPIAKINSVGFTNLIRTSNQTIWRQYKQNSHYTPTIPSSCPTGFIPVPGSPTYTTSDFCVMKYEAKQVNTSTAPISKAAGTPWVSIAQTTAMDNSPQVVGCTGCHLITEGEWLTIAQNVLSVASNWYGGVVGTNYIYSGHNDNAPANALDADTNDSNGYYGTGNVANSNQKRTLTLSNGQVIWDMAGNVWEWTSGQTIGGQPGMTGEGTYAWKEWTAVTAAGTLSPNPSPTTTGLSGASTWDSPEGVGQLYSYSASDASLTGFLRGGYYSNVNYAGVLALHLSNSPSGMSSGIGFRVAAAQ